MATTLEELRKLNNAEYQRLVALANGTAGGVNNALTTRIASLPNLTENQRGDMFADAVVASQQQGKHDAQKTFLMVSNIAVLVGGLVATIVYLYFVYDKGDNYDKLSSKSKNFVDLFWILPVFSVVAWVILSFHKLFPGINTDGYLFKCITVCADAIICSLCGCCCGSSDKPSEKLTKNLQARRIIYELISILVAAGVIQSSDIRSETLAIYLFVYTVVEALFVFYEDRRNLVNPCDLRQRHQDTVNAYKAQIIEMNSNKNQEQQQDLQINVQGQGKGVPAGATEQTSLLNK